jgi:NADPH-dependent glutamate synthase beta subunit-like oxidoreductase
VEIGRDITWDQLRRRYDAVIVATGALKPPMRSSRSKTATVNPACVSCWAAARPDGPEPTTATVVCPAPCESACVLGINQPAVTIKQVEYEIGEKALDPRGRVRAT